MARRATLRLPVSAGEMRARLYAANLVRAERIADDGAFEIDTELSEFELLKWAREPGVEVLRLAVSTTITDSTCTTRRCLPTIVARIAKQLTWPGINPVIRTTTPGARNRPPAVAISIRPSRTGRSASSRFSEAGAGVRPRHCWSSSSLPSLIWMLTGFYQVQPGNQGVVQRFGKHVETVGDGWGWRFPWPIETVTKVDVAGVKSIAYKSRVLTAEPNMVELQVAVQYRVTRAEDYPVQGARAHRHARRGQRKRHPRSGGPQRPAGHPRSAAASRSPKTRASSCSARSTSTAPASKCAR